MRLLDGFLPVFQHLNGLAEHLAESRYDSCEELKDHYKSLLARLDDAEFTDQYSEQQRGLAKFAVVILIDEKVAATDWGMLHKWSREPLQKLLFETLNGGQLFFQRLDELPDRGAEFLDVREVYLYCLRLGFTGKFFNPGEASFLSELASTQYELLLNQRSLSRLNAQATDDIDAIKPAEHRFEVRVEHWGVVMLVATVLAYLLFRERYLTAIETLLATLN